jgi:hypothetical protein
MDSQDYYTATQEQLLQELVYPGTNISTKPITILYTGKKKKIFKSQYWYNTGTGDPNIVPSRSKSNISNWLGFF